MSSEKEIRLNLRIKEDFKDLLQIAAEKESRTLTSFVINALRQYMSQHHPEIKPSEAESHASTQ